MAENKMEQVAAMNNFYKLLGRNGELINLRKEQVLAGAMHIIQQHYADSPNKMEVVAAMFGKKLGERFTVERDHDRFVCCFMRHGFETFGAYENPYMDFDVFILQELLIGTAVIIDG